MGEPIVIKFWETEEDRDQGLSEIYKTYSADKESIKKAIEDAKHIMHLMDYASIEVYNEDTGVTYYWTDGVTEEYPNKIDESNELDLDKDPGFKEYVRTLLKDGAIDDPKYVNKLSDEEFEDLLTNTWMKDPEIIDTYKSLNESQVRDAAEAINNDDRYEGKVCQTEDGMLAERIADIAEVLGDDYSEWLGDTEIKEIIDEIKDSKQYQSLFDSLSELIKDLIINKVDYIRRDDPVSKYYTGEELDESKSNGYDDNYRGNDYWELNDMYNEEGSISKEDLLDELKNRYATENGVKKAFEEITGEKLEEAYTQASNAGAIKVDIMGQPKKKNKKDKEDKALKSLPAQQVLIEGRDVDEYFGMQDNTDEEFKSNVAKEYRKLRAKYPDKEMILNGDFGTYLGTENKKPIEKGKYITVYESKKDKVLKSLPTQQVIIEKKEPKTIKEYRIIDEDTNKVIKVFSEEDKSKGYTEMRAMDKKLKEQGKEDNLVYKEFRLKNPKYKEVKTESKNKNYRDLEEAIEKDIYRYMIDNYEIDLKDDEDLNNYNVESLIDEFTSQRLINYEDANDIELYWFYTLNGERPYGIKVDIEEV